MLNPKAVVVLASVSACTLFAPCSLAQLRVATWNISFYDGTDRATAIQTAVYGSFSGRSMSPDVLLVQEVESASAVTALRNVLNTAPGSPGDWAAGPFFPGPDSQGAMLYRSTKVQFVSAFVIATPTGGLADQPRNTERFDVRPVGYTGAGATLALYCTHMKAGDTGDDNSRRLAETTRIRDNAEGLDTNPGNGVADGLPAGWNFLIGGDMNVQSSSQTAYAQLVGSQTNNAGRFFDPINTPGSWNNNSSYRFVHTQDPVGTGGMDDRHDQILVSGSLVDGQGFDYVGNSGLPYSTTTWNDPNHSYRAWGNDGTSYNAPITVAGNAMVGPAIAQALRDAASPTGGTAAGHLPILLDLRLPADVASQSVINFGTVAVNASATQTLTVSHPGDTALFGPSGFATLSYTLSTTAGFTAPSGTFTDAAGGGPNSHTITMNTSTPGVKTGTLTIASNSPDEPARVVTLTGVVGGTNQAPIASAGNDQFLTDNNNSGNESVVLNGSASSDPDGTISNYRWTEGPTQLASTASPFSVVTLSAGVHTVTLTVTDNAGLTASDTVVIDINRRPTVNAGPDQTATDFDASGAEPVTLAGSGADIDGAVTSFVWTEGSSIIATGPAPVVSLSVGTHTLTLTASDNDFASTSDTVVVTVLPGCPGDWNRDGSVDGDDVIAFFTEWDGGNADFNQDGGTDGDDVIAFFIRWDAGC
ncbi:MAG: PKD domain-containing protein [Phycisphaerales bacterium]